MSKSQVNTKKKLSEEEPATLNKKQKVNDDEGKKVAQKNKKVQDSSDSETDLVVVPTSKNGAKGAAKPVKKGKGESDSESGDDNEFLQKGKANGNKQAPAAKNQPKKVAAKKDSDDESEEAAPATKKVPAKQAAKQVPKVTSDDEESSEEEKPKTATKKGAAPQPAAKGKPQPAGKKPTKDESDDESDEPVKPQKVSATSSKAPVKKPVAKESSDDESEEEVKPKGKAAPKAAQNKKKVESEEEESEEEKAPAAKKPVAQQKKAIQNEDEEEEKPAFDAGQKGVNEVFVGNLPFTASEKHITDFFSSCGKVVSVNLLKGYDGRSKGIAFVKFDNETSVNNAVEQNGADYDGRAVKVEKSTPKESRPPREGGFGGRDGGFGGGRDGGFGGNKPQNERDPNSTTVFVGNLSYDTTDESLRSLFETCGTVKDVRIAYDKQTGNPRGFGHVEFLSTDSIDKAIAKAGAKLDGRQIRVDFSGAKKEGGEGGNRGGFGGGRGGFGGGRGGFGGGRPQGGYDDGGARKGSIGTFSGNKVRL